MMKPGPTLLTALLLALNVGGAAAMGPSLDLARRRLGDQRLAIKEVAQRLNFSTEFHFSRFFRRGTGMSPSRFRERSRA